RRVAAQATQGLFESMKGAFAKTSAVLNAMLSDGTLVRALAVPFTIMGKALEAAAAQLPAFVAWLEKIASAENLVTLFERTWALVRATTDALLRLAGIDLGKMLDPKNAVAGWEGLWQAIKGGADALFGMGRVLADWRGLATAAFEDVRDLVGRLGEDIGIGIQRGLLLALKAFLNFGTNLGPIMMKMGATLGAMVGNGLKAALNLVGGMMNGWLQSLPLIGKHLPKIQPLQMNAVEDVANIWGASQKWTNAQLAGLDRRQAGRDPFQSRFMGRAGADFRGDMGDVRGQRRFHEMMQQGRAAAGAFLGPQAPGGPGGPADPPGHQFGRVRTPASVRRMYGPGQFPSAPSMGPLVGATADMLEAAIKLAEARIENFPQFGARLQQTQLMPLLKQLFQTQ
ncbi:MAG: hypothetical protein Q7T33_10840, partial [Dehalococcoidia bacterium]|nr:hypothetical protein [Dehalococcoidia bacterium]